jgi:hypothetical protein
MKKSTNNQFDDRINCLHKRLKQMAIRHADLLDHLRPEHPRAWTEEEMGETEY